MKVLATGNDELIKAWAYHAFGVVCPCVNLAVGIIDGGTIVGAAFFQAHSGADIELSYYGPGTMTLGIVKQLAKIAVDHFGVSRVTVRTTKANKVMTKHVKKIGFVFEGICHHGYGDKDAVVFGLFGKNLAHLAGRTMQ